MLPTQQTRTTPKPRRVTAKPQPHTHRWLISLDQRYEVCTCQAYRYNQREGAKK